jgi:phenylpropionate dioxygenase-like ring-hydroxylating dioxygenase large terminal subunit
MSAVEKLLELEGTDAVLAGYWHPVALRSEIAREPYATTLLNVPLVLFENADGEVRCLRDLCIHRGAKLSLGCVSDGNLRCPFHGWEYDGDGACVKIPQLDPEERIPSRARAFAHECVERYGWVWVRLVESEHEIPAFPEWDDATFRTAQCIPFEWAATATRMVENFTDFAHLAFVHPGILGDPAHAEVPHHEVERDERGLRYEIEIPLIAVGEGSDARLAEVKVEYTLTAPYTIRTARKQDGVYTRSTFFTVQPMGADRGRGFMVLAVPSDGDDAESARRTEALLLEMVALQDVVQSQDQPIVEAQRPEHLPFDISDELHLRFDRVSVQYRHLLRSLGLH